MHILLESVLVSDNGNELLKTAWRWDELDDDNKHAVNYVIEWILGDDGGSLTLHKSDDGKVAKIVPMPVKKIGHWKMIYKNV